MKIQNALLQAVFRPKAITSYLDLSISFTWTTLRTTTSSLAPTVTWRGQYQQKKKKPPTGHYIKTETRSSRNKTNHKQSKKKIQQRSAISLPDCLGFPLICQANGPARTKPILLGVIDTNKDKQTNPQSSAVVWPMACPSITSYTGLSTSFPPPTESSGHLTRTKGISFSTVFCPVTATSRSRLFFFSSCSILLTRPSWHH